MAIPSSLLHREDILSYWYQTRAYENIAQMINMTGAYFDWASTDRKDYLNVWSNNLVGLSTLQSLFLGLKESPRILIFSLIHSSPDPVI